MALTSTGKLFFLRGGDFKDCLAAAGHLYPLAASSPFISRTSPVSI
jgi:hypothetical protein